MWPNPQCPADLFTFTGEILNGKLHFLYSQDCIRHAWGVVHVKGCLQRRDKHCSLLIMQGFCSDNALYSASLSFTMSNFFYWHLRLLLFWKCLHQSILTQLFSQFSKQKEMTFPRELIFAFIPYFVRAILSEKCQKWGV